MTTLVVIPARAGSKGLRNKNIQICAGETLLRRTAQLATSIQADTRIVVSTDSPSYLDHVRDILPDQRFLRPTYLSGDQVGDCEVLVHALHTAEAIYSERYSEVLMLQPTSPLRQLSHVQQSLTAVADEGYQCALTVHKVDKKYHPYKILHLNSEKNLELFDDNGSNIVARQQLGEIYIRNGASYCISTISLCLQKTFFLEKTKPILTSPMISIDSIDDLLQCERIILDLDSSTRI